MLDRPQDITRIILNPEHQSGDLCSSTDFRFLDCRDMTGTRGYCDPEAEQELLHRIQKQGEAPSGIHFLDNGNYHYLSALYCSLIREPFALVLLDHHPDTQLPSFGDILSCGGWVRTVCDENPFVKKVFSLGVDPALAAEASDGLEELVQYAEEPRNLTGSRSSWFRERIREIEASNLPVFVSLDKDVICREDLETNWDQGWMRAEEVLVFLQDLADSESIHLLGLDVCGGCSDHAGEDDLIRDAEFERRLIALFNHKAV